MVSEVLENNVKMFSMVLLVLGINKNVVDKNQDKLVKLWHKNLIHEIHEVGRSIVRPKDMTKYSYSPYRVEKAVFGISHGRILI
jgi:hypothetical protein